MGIWGSVAMGCENDWVRELEGQKREKRENYGEASVNALVSFAVVLLLLL